MLSAYLQLTLAHPADLSSHVLFVQAAAKVEHLLFVCERLFQAMLTAGGDHLFYHVLVCLTRTLSSEWAAAQPSPPEGAVGTDKTL